MVSNANVLGIGVTTNETISPYDYTNVLAAQLQNWLAINPTLRPQYVVLFQDIPSRVSTVLDYFTNFFFPQRWPSVQYQLNQSCAPGWNPFVSSINMNGLVDTIHNTSDGTNDCIAYIDKLAWIGSNYSPGQLIISPPPGLYGNTNWYFNDKPMTGWGYQAYLGVSAKNPSSSIFYTNGTTIISSGTNVAGYASWGWNGGLGSNYAVDGSVVFTNNSGWYIIQTDESYNGRRWSFQGNFLKWFSINAFEGTNYENTGLAYRNTPVGAVTQVDEPGTAVNNPSNYFGFWASGKIFASCAWNSFYNYGTPYPQVIGDPFTKW